MERNRLRNILFFLFFILLVLFGAWYTYDYFLNQRTARADIEEINEVAEEKTVPAEMEELPVQEVMPEAAESESVGETAMETENEDLLASESEAEQVEATMIERYATGEHEVKEGESFSLITGFYWEDIFLWPDLYIRNSMRSDDPDLIYPEEIITIYNRLGKGDDFSVRETEEILEAYLEVYEVYKKLGEKKNNSVWSLLWCAARYDHDFLDKYGDRIDPADKAMAQKYIDEQGFLD